MSMGAACGMAAWLQNIRAPFIPTFAGSGLFVGGIGLYMNMGQDGAKKCLELLKNNNIEALNVEPPKDVDVGDSFTNKQMRQWTITVFRNLINTIKE